MIRVAGSFTQTLQAWIIRHGIECPELSTRLGLLARRDAISVEEWRALLGEAAALAPGQPVGIQIGAEVQVAYTGVLGYLVLNSESLADALETYLLCERHFYGVSFARLQCTDTAWTLSWPDPLGDDNALFVQVALSTLVTFLRKRFPEGCELVAVSLTGTAPDDIAIYEDFFACPVSFESTSPGVSFNAATVYKAAPGLPPGDFHSMRCQQQEAFSNVIRIEDPFLLRLQHVLLKGIPEGSTTLPQVARELCCSARSVQRKLQHYNLSYQALLDSVREELAQRYLLRTSLRLSELPLLLGFSDQSAFSRAFKSWTGTSPGNYRRSGGRWQKDKQAGNAD
jgi:AraC-like DNA-binding protein